MTDLSHVQAAIAAALRTDAAGSQGPAAVTAGVAARAMPGDGSAVTLMFSDQQRQTLAATDEVIDALEQAQYTVGEGPSLDAFTTGRPVLLPDLSQSAAQAVWPGLTERLAALPVRALFAFPMRLGATTIGVILSYRRDAEDLDPDQIRFALRLTNMLTLALLQVHNERPDPDSAEGTWPGGDGKPQTWTVHQATGMVMVHLGGVPASTAFSRLRGHAFAHDATLEDVAADIIAGRLTLQPDPPPE